MQMDSYYAFHDDAHFLLPHGAVPASPELPFDLIASPELPFGTFITSPELEMELEPEPAELSAAARQSSFQGYSSAGHQLGAAGEGMVGAGSNANIHRRVIDVLGRMDAATADHAGERGDQEERRQGGGAAAVESSRGFRHMMRERQRREKLSQSYADLYAMVSSRSKGDKNSIVQSAAIYIHELRGARDQLQRRNQELKAKILGHDAQRQCVKVQFEVDEPSSSIDSMIGALRRLKSMDVKARGIRSTMSGGHKLCTEMDVETTIAASEVEKAVEEALKEVERNQSDKDIPLPGNRGYPLAQTSHVQNVF